MDWNIIIAIVIIVGFVLTIWARVSHQTIGELLSDIKDLFVGTGEDKVESITQIYE